MSEARWDDTLSRPVVRAESELAFASLLGLSPGYGAAGSHPMRAAMVVVLVLGLALVLALFSLGAVT